MEVKYYCFMDLYSQIRRCLLVENDDHTTARLIQWALDSVQEVVKVFVYNTLSLFLFCPYGVLQ